MKIPGISFSPKRALGITKLKQKISRKTGVPMTRQGLERKIGGAILKKLTKGVAIVSILGVTASCGGNGDRQQFKAQMREVDRMLDGISSSISSFKDEPSIEAVQGIMQSISDCDPEACFSDLELTPEQQDMLEEKKDEMKSLVDDASAMCDEYVSSHDKIIASGEILLEGQQVYSPYLKKGTTLRIGCHSEAPVTVNFYNADSRKLLKTFKKAEISEVIEIANTAIYLVELNAPSPQYCDLSISHSVDSFEDYSASSNVRSEQIESTAGAFRAKKLPGIDLRPVFEEPYKITLRSRGKYILDTSSPYRTIVAVNLPAGSTDILYHLRISTTDSDSSSDGEFCDDVRSTYKKIKFLGLPLYESTKSSSSIFREILNEMSVSREEKAYCNLLVFNSQAQAKKFLTNAKIEALTYDIDHSCNGTQSRNERIPVKGMRTIYLGFENTREFHDVFLWLEVIAAVPQDVYYSEKYSLE